LQGGLGLKAEHDKFRVVILTMIFSDRFKPKIISNDFSG
jgi:hypothetical protein